MSLLNKDKRKSPEVLIKLKSHMIIFKANMHRMLQDFHPMKPIKLPKDLIISRRPIMILRVLMLKTLI